MIARKELEAALSELTAAESALEAVLGELRGGPRAEKVTVSTAVDTAFARVRSARSVLAALREELDEDRGRRLRRRRPSCLPGMARSRPQIGALR